MNISTYRTCEGQPIDTAKLAAFTGEDNGEAKAESMSISEFVDIYEMCTVLHLAQSQDSVYQITSNSAKYEDHVTYNHKTMSPITSLFFTFLPNRNCLDEGDRRYYSDQLFGMLCEEYVPPMSMTTFLARHRSLAKLEFRGTDDAKIATILSKMQHIDPNTYHGGYVTIKDEEMTNDLVFRVWEDAAQQEFSGSVLLALHLASGTFVKGAVMYNPAMLDRDTQLRAVDSLREKLLRKPHMIRVPDEDVENDPVLEEIKAPSTESVYRIEIKYHPTICQFSQLAASAIAEDIVRSLTTEGCLISYKLELTALTLVVIIIVVCPIVVNSFDGGLKEQGIDVTSAVSLSLVCAAILIGAYKAVRNENWTFYDMFRGRGYSTSLAVTLKSKGSIDLLPQIIASLLDSDIGSQGILSRENASYLEISVPGRFTLDLDIATETLRLGGSRVIESVGSPLKKYQLITFGKIGPRSTVCFSSCKSITNRRDGTWCVKHATQDILVDHVRSNDILPLKG
ncbi:hypothetical protein BGZ68_002812 [Mortierella alpina]|nr:hypothetical protein BGZ68_002812 [Mortierella alpina]